MLLGAAPVRHELLADLVNARRHDDPTANPEADDVEEFFASLPKMIRRLRRGRWQNLTVAVFTLVAFLTVSHAQEKAADQDRRDAYAQCRLVNDNAVALNQFLDQVIASVKSSPTLTDRERATRISAYESIKQQLPVCERP